MKNESYSDTTDEEELWITALHANKTKLTAVMNVNRCSIRFQLNSGAQSNTIQKEYVRMEQVRRPHLFFVYMTQHL